MRKRRKGKGEKEEKEKKKKKKRRKRRKRRRKEEGKKKKERRRSSAFISVDYRIFVKIHETNSIPICYEKYINDVTQNNKKFNYRDLRRRKYYIRTQLRHL